MLFLTWYVILVPGLLVPVPGILVPCTNVKHTPVLVLVLLQQLYQVQLYCINDNEQMRCTSTRHVILILPGTCTWGTVPGTCTRYLYQVPGTCTVRKHSHGHQTVVSYESNIWQLMYSFNCVSCCCDFKC